MSDYLVFVVKTLMSWLLLHLFGAVPQSNLRSCLLGLQSLGILPNKTYFSTLGLCISFQSIARLVSSEVRLLELQTVTFLSSHGFPSGPDCVVISSFYKDTSQIGLGPILMIS